MQVFSKSPIKKLTNRYFAIFIILNLQTSLCLSLRGMELVSTEEEQRISKPTSAFRRMTTRRKTTIAKPSLSRYDGIRFHIKKRGKFPN